MTWTQVQQQRLQVERQILKKYFPSFSWINPTDSNNTRVEGSVRTNAGNTYTLRVYVPSDFPNSRPDMAVTSPYPLKGHNGKDLYETDSSMHTLAPRDGYVKICHYKDWLPDLTLYLVVLKGRIWLEALEGHRRTGQLIDSFLAHMK
jgi:ubiquitin-protein ligase